MVELGTILGKFIGSHLRPWMTWGTMEIWPYFIMVIIPNIAISTQSWVAAAQGNDLAETVCGITHRWKPDML